MASPYAYSTWSSVSNSSDSRIAPLVIGTKWGGALGVGAVVTYSFPGALATWAGSYPESSASDYRGLNSQERNAARQALKAWSDVANITFVETSDTAKDVGDI